MVDISMQVLTEEEGLSSFTDFPLAWISSHFFPPPVRKAVGRWLRVQDQEDLRRSLILSSGL